MPDRFDFGPHIKALEDMERKYSAAPDEAAALRRMLGMNVQRAPSLHAPPPHIGRYLLNKAEPSTKHDAPRLEEIPAILRKTLDDANMVDSGPYEWEIEGKSVILWPLYTRRGLVSVCKAYLPMGVVFPVHVHGEMEMLICFEGMLEYRSKGLRDRGIPERRLLPGECVRIIPREPHEVTALMNSWVITVTVPDSPGMPSKECLTCPETRQQLRDQEDSEEPHNDRT